MKPEDHREDGGYRPAFEDEWPPLARRLHVVLRNRKLSPDLTEDIIQETGLRLFEIWARVDPEREPWPLALTIALNIVRDQIRTDSRRQQITSHDELIEKSAERCALARVELLRVGEALEHLTAAQRSALLAEVGLEADPLENSSALKMLRMRARRRLRDLIEGASGIVATIELGLHKLGRSGSLNVGEQLAPCISLATGVVCVATLATSGSPAQALPSEPTEQHARSVQVNEVHAHSAFGRSVARIYGSVIEPRRAKGLGPDFLEVARVIADPEDKASPPKRLERIPSEDPKSLATGPNMDSPASHRENASVGREGYKASGGVKTEAAGHQIQAEVESSGTRNPTSATCRGTASAGCSPQAPAEIEARARAELDEKGIELGVGGKRSS